MNKNDNDKMKEEKKKEKDKETQKWRMRRNKDSNENMDCKRKEAESGDACVPRWNARDTGKPGVRKSVHTCKPDSFRCFAVHSSTLASTSSGLRVDKNDDDDNQAGSEWCFIKMSTVPGTMSLKGEATHSKLDRGRRDMR